MNKGAFTGIIITLFIPIACYFIIKFLGENAISMPRKYFPDSVITLEKNGKVTTDTQWHQIKNFTLTNQLGQPFNLYDLKGKIVVVNSFFTRCPNICPALTRNIRKLQKSYEEPKNKSVLDTPKVYFVSLSIDPERDSVNDLKKFADRFEVNSDNWSMLTGPKEGIYDLLLKELKIPALDGEAIDTNFIHSDKIVLIDKNHIVRGYYNGLDSIGLSHLAEDIGKLILEKDKNKPSILKEFVPILPLIMAIPFIVFLFMWLINRRNKFAK